MRLVLILFVVFRFWSNVLAVESIVFVEEPSAAKAVDMIRTGALDIFGAGVTDPSLLQKIKEEPNLACAQAYTAVWHLSFNPAGPLFEDGRLNPFSDPRAREALNWLVDREYIVQEILAGAGLPQVLPLRPIFPDYARLAEYARPLELRYYHDPVRAKSALVQVMKDLGAELVQGRWVRDGAPVEIRFLIRTDARRALGDYVARLLEELGFSVTPIYAGFSEALRVLSAPPEKGLWHIYTGSLVVSLIERDEAATFQLNYTPVFPYPPWQYLRPDPEFSALAARLAAGDYESLAERAGLMAQALELSMRDSAQVWLAVRASCYPHSADLSVGVDLAAGLSTGVWARTLRTEKDTVGIALPSLLSAPWNPIAGSFTVYDQTIIRATTDFPALPDPQSGLHIPVDLSWAEVEVKEGQALQKTLDWVEVRPVPKISVPREAWLDWDPKAQRFLTVAELHPEGLESKAKVVLHFREDLWEKTWHDGTPLSLGDFLLRFILLFDRAKSQSAVYDESAVPAWEALRAHFRGLVIKNTAPLTVEVYTDLRFLDAEWLVAKAGELIYPAYERGPRPWHVLSLLILAEEEGKLAVSQSKAKALGVEWANLVAGQSLAILWETLKEAERTGFVPYAGILGKYIAKEEAEERYARLSRFFEERRHFWVGNGPFYLELVKPVEKVLVLRRWPNHLERPGGWASWERPLVPWVEVRGPAVVEPGQSPEFVVVVGQGEELVSEKAVLFVKYLVFDSANELVEWGFAEPSDGAFKITLTPATVAKLDFGPARVEVVAAAREVALSAVGSFTFVVVGPGG